MSPTEMTEMTEIIEIFEKTGNTGITKMQQIPKSAIFCGAILTLALCPVASGCSGLFSLQNAGAALAQASGSAEKVIEEAKNDKLPACLAEISRATTIEDATLRSGVMRPNILGAQKLGNAAHDDLVALLKTATPAGRVISLCLLKRIDPGHYNLFVDQLRAESGDLSVSYVSPGERCHYTVNDILNDLASARPSIKVLY